MAKGSLVIQVSFKKRITREVKIFMYVDALEEKSDFVKDALEFYIQHIQGEK